MVKKAFTSRGTKLLTQGKNTNGALLIGSPATPGSVSGLPIFTLPNGKLVRCGVDDGRLCLWISSTFDACVDIRLRVAKAEKARTVLKRIMTLCSEQV